VGAPKPRCLAAAARHAFLGALHASDRGTRSAQVRSRQGERRDSNPRPPGPQLRALPRIWRRNAGFQSLEHPRIPSDARVWGQDPRHPQNQSAGARRDAGSSSDDRSARVGCRPLNPHTAHRWRSTRRSLADTPAIAAATRGSRGRLRACRYNRSVRTGSSCPTHSITSRSSYPASAHQVIAVRRPACVGTCVMRLPSVLRSRVEAVVAPALAQQRLGPLERRAQDPVADVVAVAPATGGGREHEGRRAGRPDARLHHSAITSNSTLCIGTSRAMPPCGGDRRRRQGRTALVELER
jgi:hypothetical protein